MKKQVDESRALKHLFGPAHLRRVSRAFEAARPGFQGKSFRALASRLETLEMKPRVRLLRDELRARLPAEYRQALTTLLKAVEKSDLRGFDLWPLTELIQADGLEHPRESLEALRELTKRFTAEFAVRPFLIQHQKLTLSYLKSCVRDPDVHVRRWVSEGSRPRLPWGERLRGFVENPRPGLALIEPLRFDPELYVRKSVANHLNDIAKDHPALVVKTLERWRREARGEECARIAWIIPRALRTLIKDGNVGALKLIGAPQGAKVRVRGFALERTKVRFGEALEFECAVTSASPRTQKLVIDYVLHFRKANGTLVPKVFKLKTVELGRGETVRVVKRHAVKPITTRAYHAGTQRLSIQINGRVVATTPWTLRMT